MSGNQSATLFYNNRALSLVLTDNGDFDLILMCDHRDGNHDGFHPKVLLKGKITEDEKNNEIQNDTFEKELASLINKYSLENMSDTPNYILASYLMNCLDAFSHTMSLRSRFYASK